VRRRSRPGERRARRGRDAVLVLAGELERAEVVGAPRAQRAAGRAAQLRAAEALLLPAQVGGGGLRVARPHGGRASSGSPGRL
jgi:hypothetical protein